jgi:phosphate transport system permease protein
MHLLAFLLRFFAYLALVCIALLLVTLAGGLIYSGIQAGGGIFSAFSFTWSPETGHYGIFSMAVGSVTAATLGTLLALPLSLGLLICIWVYNNAFSRFLRGLLRFMAGVPTVVYGFFGIFLLIPLLRGLVPGSGYNLFIVSIVLSLIILPVLTLMADSAMNSKFSGDNIIDIAVSLGISREKAFVFVALPVLKKELTSALLLAFSRALGDTLIALMLSGNSPLAPQGLFASFRTLSGHISLLTATAITPQIEFTLFLSGFLLFAVALGISAVARGFRR